MIIRSENSGDGEAIARVTNEAFKQPDEGKLVCALRDLPEFEAELSLVAVDDGNIIGHLLLTPVKIINGTEEYNTLALAPMSVMPSRQRQGVGSALIKAALKTAIALGHQSIIVLGHSDYYPRFGFKRASKWHIKPPFNVPDKSFMAIELMPGTLANQPGVVTYPEPFMAL